VSAFPDPLRTGEVATPHTIAGRLVTAQSAWSNRTPPTEFTRTKRANRTGKSRASAVATPPPNECPTTVTGPVTPAASRNRVIHAA